MSTGLRSLFPTLLVSLALTSCNISAPAAMMISTQVSEPVLRVTATPEDLVVTGGPAVSAVVETRDIVLVPTPTSEFAPGQSAGEPPNQNMASLDKPCDLVNPGQPFDVTIPDGTLVEPGEPFSKTWRLVNAGSCTWTGEYSIAWFSGEPVGLDNQTTFSGEVSPGEMVDVTVEMMAPQKAGVYQSNWKLRNNRGEFFGIGPNGDAPFWVIVEVKEPGTATVPVEPSPAPTLTVQANGIISLTVQDGLDLDIGALNTDTGVDLRYQQVTNGAPQILPENGASVGLYGDFEPVEEDCQKASLGAGALTIQNAEQGSYVCYRTSAGLPGFAHVIRIGEEDSLLALDFITWTVP